MTLGLFVPRSFVSPNGSCGYIPRRRPYFDFEAYGRDMRINEGGHFAPTGYLTRSGDFKEVYHGIEDIPAEHRIFAYPKLNIREQMTAYKEVIDRSSLEGERLHPRNEHDDR